MRQFAGIILCTMLVLIGCHQHDLSYDYLMTHPQDLQELFYQCQQKQTVSCDTVQRAMNDFSVLINEQAFNPQQFGTRIMHAQQQLMNLYQEYQLAKRESHHDQILLAEEAYRDQQQQLQMLYQVVASALSRSK